MNIYLGSLIMFMFAGLAVYARLGNRLKGLGFTFMVFAFASAAFTFPACFVSLGGFELKRTIVPLVQLILFGMGMTLSFDDFRRVLKMPRAVFIGMGLQFTIMPFVGFLCARVFGLEAGVAAGLVLIGSCPGGVASNVIVYLARGNVPLSVTMTACSTMISPLMTPLAMKLLAGTYVPIAFLPMMVSIFKMIILPLVVGLLIHRYLPRLAKVLVKVLPSLAMLSICIIIGVTIALSRDDLLKVGLALFGAAACHNALGYLLGYQAARFFRMSARDCRTVAIEVGIQNGGMATGLAFNILQSTQAAMAAATFGPWSAITSSMLASCWRKREGRSAVELQGAGAAELISSDPDKSLCCGTAEAE
ncbi:bile acid:sodium symporter family protein [Tichowtungia aerotolerans]|uniref:Bile acid:sodium symporter family protein n=1 Tax=Tichowtungia aerotolerans TaxID=2697043 RepID=A0A6P1M6A2_9BACT|nr:bile acid:sodium symporter family protein [Tichowtungia aerotolerans]QHI68533.1 bile acid:sodium symporter family protein [Tichowtungia aerotolerans]